MHACTIAYAAKASMLYIVLPIDDVGNSPEQHILADVSVYWTFQATQERSAVVQIMMKFASPDCYHDLKA